ncbi:hypothetical protein ABH935_007845 [Catenulispora sp. GAS73]|uniref:alkaline phosphatase family protein n=1 Tax=Catenulispora sp. GAS73 TaxID=3156269 RepID=UPI003515A994
MSLTLRASLAAAALVAAAVVPAGASTASAAAGPGHYDHVFVIVEENHGFTDVIGNPAAPNLNALAKQYGLATDYTGVSHPSEPNYVGLLGGDTFTVTSDNAYYTQKVDKPSLISQLDAKRLPWKAYLQSLPHAGYQGICFPANCNGAPDKDPLYVSKHDGIQNFTTSDNPRDWNNQVPVDQLDRDLASGDVPAFGWVIPDECHDQHGDPPYCLDSGNVDNGAPATADPQDQRLVATGDAYLGQLVHKITSASFWAKGNNAVAITYDEGDDNTGGGGQVATVLVTSHGPRNAQDATPYNHYSLLDTVEQNFALGCLAHACDAATRPLTPLLAPTGSAAQAYRALPVPSYATPTPIPSEPVTTVNTPISQNGWAVQPAPYIGTGDNTFGAVAAVSKNDVWAVGNYLPDAATANQDATLTMAAHYDGTKWTSTATPNPGPNFGTLFGVAAVPDKAWAVGVGVALGADFLPHSVIEAWNGSAWSVVSAPKLNAQRDILYSATAVNDHDVWAAGIQQNRTGTFGTLIEHFDGSSWSVVPTPNPGTFGNQLYGISADGPNSVYAVGQRDDAHSDTPLVLHWDGRCWSEVHVPGADAALLQSVSVRDGEVWAVGQTDDSTHQAVPFVEHFAHGVWTEQTAANLGAPFSDVTAVTATGKDNAWLAGTYYSDAAGKQVPALAHHDATGWHPIAAPDPGSGDTVLGGLSTAGGQVWAVGFAKTAAGRSPLIELHQD